jgi:hypothetical protein
MGTNFALLLVDLFIYFYEEMFITNTFQIQRITEANAFNLTFMYIDDVLSIKNPDFVKWIPLPQRF